MTINAEAVKTIALATGADLCGVAGVERFAGAPRGFHPVDIFPQSRSVVVVATRFPEGPFHARSMVPYTAANDALLEQMTGLLCGIGLILEQAAKLKAVPVPGEPYDYWDRKRREGRGLLSLKHAGHLAGLGVLGRSTLLVTPQLGNRIVLGALLLDIDLESDAILAIDPCPPDCRLCMDTCPVKAIDGTTVNQKRCRSHSGVLTAKGYALYTCCHCRTVCPNARGLDVR